jgi:hypothetical protein
MSLRTPIFAIVSVAIFAGCTSGPTVHLQTAEVTASARLKKVTHRKWGDAIWANLSIKGTTMTLESADIDCFVLRVGRSVSKDLWVDSLMDISRGDYPAYDGKVIVSVYWPMEDFSVGTNTDLPRATLELKPRLEGSCFKFTK